MECKATEERRDYLMTILDIISDIIIEEGQIPFFMDLEDIEQRQAQLQLMSHKASVTIELADIEKIEKVIGSNKAAKKLFVFSLIKAKEQAIHNGQLTKDYISFPLQELVDIGFYKSLRSAKTGFFSAMDILTSLKTNRAVLFTGATRVDGQCVVYLNNHINWSFLIQYYNDDKYSKRN